MRSRFTFTLAFRRAVVGLLACLVPLHALASGVIAVAGPSHTHRAAVSTRLVLDDFRRSQPRPVAEAHVDIALLHPHAHAQAERHRHAAGDASVVVDPGDRLLAADADDPAFSPSLAVFVGLIAATPGWSDRTTAARAAAPPRWRLQTHLPAVPERPPRARA